MSRAPFAAFIVIVLAALAAPRAAGAAEAAADSARSSPAPADSALAPAPAASPADSALGRYLGGLSDSTDRYFRVAAAPLDTAGLDTALANRLLIPPRIRRQIPLGAWPDISFDRVDGTVWGVGAGIGGARGAGRLNGRIRWAVGSRTRLGGGDYTLVRPLLGRPARLTVAGGRTTEAMDRDDPSAALASLRALLFGTDTRRLLRRDGWTLALDQQRDTWHAAVGFRDQLERPLPVTTTWNLSRQALVVPDNVAATRGRARELRFAGGWRLPHTPLDLDAEYLTSGRRLASDFEYRRLYASLSGDVGLGRWLSAVPQLVYGRLRGDALPQASFYLGGGGSLRTLDGGAQGGTGLALARLDLMGTFDVLAAMHVPHPAMLPLQLGAFTATGATWGVDPYGGPTRPGTDWPKGTWLPEVGASVVYQPGLPLPDELVRLDYAWPVGPRHGRPGLTLSYTHTFGLVRSD